MTTREFVGERKQRSIFLEPVALKTMFVIGSMFALFVASVPLHEFGHFISAKIMGISGSIHIYWNTLSGCYVPQNYPVSSPEGEIIAFSGGGFVAFAVFILWLILPFKRKLWVSIPLLGTVAWCLVVATSELIWYL